MPDVYYDIRRLIEQQDTNIQDFVDIIETDSVLALRLMRIANSPYFGFPHRADNLNKAISQFGLIQLHDLVLSCLALRTFATIPQQIFNLEAFWRYCVQNGIAARTLAQYGQIMPINPFFTLGLMHEVGHAAIYIKEPELALRAFDEAQESKRPLIQVEQELLGFDYTQVGVELMQLWRMPEVYHQVSAYHLDADQADAVFRQTVAIIELAHVYCQQPEAGHWQDLLEQVLQNDQRLRRLPPNIESIIDNETTSNTDNVLTMLWPNCTRLESASGEPEDE